MIISYISKLLAFVLTLVVISKTYIDYRRGRESRQLFIIWMSIWLVLLIVIAFPGLIDYISLKLSNQTTSVGALFGLAFTFLLFLMYRIYAKAARIEYNQNKLIRALALKEFIDEEMSPEEPDQIIKTAPLASPKPPTKTAKLIRPPAVAVVIVSYNGLGDLEDCLKSLRVQDYPNYEVIVVDNASKEPIVSTLQKKYPEVELIASDKNLGFAAGNNLGVKRALKNGAKYVFFLNPDTEADTRLISETVNAATDKTIVQPLVLLYEKKRTQLVNTDGNVVNYLGFSYCGNYRKLARLSGEEGEITVASGAAMLVPASFLRTYGGFDESLFMYHEDVDMCWRARLLGYSIRIQPTAKVWHRYVFSRNANKIFYAERNRLVFLFKNYQWRTLLLITPMLLVNEIVAILFSLISNSFGPKMRSYRSFWQLLPVIRQGRAEIQKIRQLSDRQLSPYLTGRLDFTAVRLPLIGLYNALLSGYWQVAKIFI